VVVKVELDDHGHATLIVHGEPEIIQSVAAAVTLILAVDAEEILTPEEFEERLNEEDEDLASSS